MTQLLSKEQLMPSPNHLEPSFQVDQEDGARWSVYEDPADVRRYTIVTSAGHEHFHDEDVTNELRSLVSQYRAVEIGDIALLGANPDVRQEIGRGQEATVYSMGPYAVREEKGLKDVYVALGQLERMDAINSVIEAGLPRWLNLPSHYALYSDPERQKTYTIMEKVNGGLTAEDVIEYPEVSPAKAILAEHALGPHIEDAKLKVPELFDQSHQILSEAINAAGKDPARYLTDWHPRNAIVERRESPRAGSNYTLHVIDQYRS